MKSNFPNILFALLFAVNAAGANEFGSNWSISGFGTLSVLGTDSTQLGFVRDRTQTNYINSIGITPDSRLGLQLDLHITDSLHLTSQFVARDHEGDFLEQNLEWAFLSWTPAQDLQIRLGRVGADLFLLSDYRNVGYAYPWMRPPHEFYGNVPIYHFDGGDISKKFFYSNSLLTLKAFAGYTVSQLPTDRHDVMKLFAPVAGGSLVYESGNWRTRIGYSYLSLSLAPANIEQQIILLKDPTVNALLPNIQSLIPYLQLTNNSTHFFSLGTSYDDGTWLAHAEASYSDTQTVLSPNQASGYLSIGRRLNKLTLYTLYGIAYSFDEHVPIPKPLVALPQLQALTQLADHTLNDNGTHEQSLSFGLRWDIFPKMALKSEWSHYWFGNNGVDLWQVPSMITVPKQTNVWSVGIDFTF